MSLCLSCLYHYELNVIHGARELIFRKGRHCLLKITSKGLIWKCSIANVILSWISYSYACLVLHAIYNMKMFQVVVRSHDFPHLLEVSPMTKLLGSIFMGSRRTWANCNFLLARINLYLNVNVSYLKGLYRFSD